MACIYIYKGHTFNSELELDDFLLENRPYESVLGDLVFSRTPAQNNISTKLSQIAKDTVQVKKKYKEWKKNNKITYNEDGDESFEQPPYIGVNKFLSGLKNASGELLFPEFREEEYWSRRFSHWKVGDFNEAEIEEFGLDKSNLPKVTDLKQQEQLRDQMKHKWEIQAKTGTAIHNILQICFQRQGDNYNFEMDDQALTDYINSHLEKDNIQYLNESTIQQTIQYAKKLHQDLTYKLGDGLLYYPEFTITQDTNVVHNGTPTKLLGMIDLLVVDREGNTHILDYKTSIHSYEHFDDAKKNAYSYQLATYQRMLEKYGINTYGGQLLVAPIQIKDFKKIPGTDQYEYSGISAPNSFMSIDTSLNTQKMWDNIDEFMPAPFKLSLTAERLNETITEMMSQWFPDYSNQRKVTRDIVIAKLKKLNLLTPDENGLYKYNKQGRDGTSITATSETEFVDKVLKYEESQPAYRLRATQNVKRFIREAMKNGIDNASFPPPASINADGERTWIRDTLKKYCDGNWELVQDQTTEMLEQYGILTLKTKEGLYPEQVDFVRVSTNFLDVNYRKYLEKDNPLRSRIGLTGTFETDVAQKSKPRSMMLQAANGNIELMETMLILNQIKGLEGHTIGNIAVVDPIHADSMQASNEELLYCFNELNKHKPVRENNIGLGNSKLKFATKYELLRAELARIINSGNANDWKGEYSHLKAVQECTSLLDQAITNNEDKIRAIKILIKKMQTDTYTATKLKSTYTKQSDLSNKEVSLYNSALYALAQLNGINFRQQLEDHDKWLESVFVLTKGMSGSQIDNPGNLDSETLNLITSLVTEAYQNTRDDVQRALPEIRKLVEDLKQEKGFNLLQENTIGNQTNLYSNMTEVTPDGDFMFKNPERLQGAERKFLEYVLNVINKNRFPDKTGEELQKMRENDDPRYYRVPLAQGGLDSVSSSQGMLSALKAKLSYLAPKQAYMRAQRTVEGVFNAEDYDDVKKRKSSSELIYQMTNYFDGGEGDYRLDKIKELGVQNLEHNLETLVLKHIFAYSVKENMDAVFPTIKAAMVHLSIQGANRNTEYEGDRKYLEDYVKNKVLNKSLITPKYQGWANVLGQLRQAASTLTLAVAPVQALYQSLQGFWTDISLMIRKPDGKDSFTFQNFRKAVGMVYKDLSHFSDRPTLCSAFNQLYAINDMDMNTYIDRISTGRKGFWNFDNFLFKFASRPDYYNRMSIFVAQMIGDGCLDAHHLDKDGRLVYDWKKDKRFEAFANGRTSDPNYNKQKSLYYTVASQFVSEHAKNADGTEFKLNMSNPMPLPRAYTNREAESMKALGDRIYGYYSHEKKSLVMSSFIGSMWMQFKTYWSSKKDQYLQPGGVRVMGNWKHYSERIKDPQTGEMKEVKYYYQVDANGNVRYDLPPTTQETIAPVMQWEGIWQEGIFLTLSNIGKHIFHPTEMWRVAKETWNNDDERLRQAYRNNIKQFTYDLSLFILGGTILSAILGDWLDDLLKENKDSDDLLTGLQLAAANIAVMSVRNSFLDFNFIESIAGPIGQWTPFSVEWGARTFSNLVNTAVGDTSVWDGVIKMSGGLSQVKPLLDTIRPEAFDKGGSLRWGSGAEE